MIEKRDNFAIYGNVFLHLSCTILWPLICFVLVLTKDDFWMGIGLGGLIILVFLGSFTITKEWIGMDSNS